MSQVELTKEEDGNGTAARSNSLLADEMLPEAPAVGATPNPMLTDDHSNDVKATLEVELPTALPTTTTETAVPVVDTNNKAVTKRWTWKKPAGKPNRPLSAYNLFFADVRASLEQPLDFVTLASHVAKKWHDIDPAQKADYQAKARMEKEKYRKDVGLWKETTAASEQEGDTEPDERPSKKQKTDCANCPVCLAKAQNNSMDFDGPYYIISCSKEFARQLANADIPGFQATFVADPSANQSSTDGKEDGGFDYAAAIEEALQASAEPALDRQTIDRLIVRLEEQRSLAAVRQHTQQLEYFEQNNQDEGAEPPENSTFETTELLNDVNAEV